MYSNAAAVLGKEKVIGPAMHLSRMCPLRAVVGRQLQQSVLDPLDLSLQLRRIQLRVLAREPLLAGPRQILRAAQPLIRSLGWVISLLHLTAVSFFAFEFHHRLKIVGIESQVAVELIDQGQLLPAPQALIAKVPPHNGVVLLLHKKVVVLSIWPRTRESNDFITGIIHPIV